MVGNRFNINYGELISLGSYLVCIYFIISNNCCLDFFILIGAIFQLSLDISLTKNLSCYKC